jgi:C4-dicarboxylate transporter, DctQ subunit
MEQLANLFDRMVGRMSAAAAMLACVGIVVMAVGVTVNAVSRYIFNSPLMFVDEYAQYLMVIVFYLGVGYTLRAGKHVWVEMLVSRLSHRAQTVLRLAVLLASLVAIAVMCYYSWTSFFSTVRAGIVSVTPMQTPLSVPFLAVAVGMTLFVLEIVASILNDAARLGRRAGG